MRRIRSLLALEVALSCAAVACGGTSLTETQQDASRAPDSSGALDGPGSINEAGGDASTPDGGVPGAADGDTAGCEDVGKGPGIESCCDGKICHGTCHKPTRYFPACKCDTAVCPPAAACCWIANPETGKPFGPFCVAPEDCVSPQ